MSDDRRSLTLGALYHHLRNGIGDSGSSRVVVLFEQRSSIVPIAAPGSRTDAASRLFVKRSFEADMEFTDGHLVRGRLQSLGATDRPQADILVVSDRGQWWYTFDQRKFGRMAGPPRLFDMRGFEEQLEEITIDDVTLEEGAAANGRTIHALDVDLEGDAFGVLLSLFGADADREDDELDMSAFSLSLTAIDDVTVDYWWSLSGQEFGPPENDGDPSSGIFSARIACHVSIRLEPLPDPSPLPIIDTVELPDATHIDDVWALTRSHPPRAGNSS